MKFVQLTRPNTQCSLVVFIMHPSHLRLCIGICRDLPQWFPVKDSDSMLVLWKALLLHLALPFSVKLDFCYVFILFRKRIEWSFSFIILCVQCEFTALHSLISFNPKVLDNVFCAHTCLNKMGLLSSRMSVHRRRQEVFSPPSFLTT